MKTLALLVIAASSFALLAGCKVESDPQAQQQIKTGAENAWEKTKKVAGDAGQATKKAMGQSGETAKLKIAISNRNDVDTSNISIETIDKTIYVKGVVPDQKQHDKVLQIIRVTADDGYTVQDDLKVTAPKKPVVDKGINNGEF